MGKNNLIFGIHPLIEALEAGREIDKILLKRGLRSSEVSHIMDVAKERTIPVQIVPEERLTRLTRKQHQGVIAFISEIEYTQLDQLIPMLYEEGRSPFVVLLDGLTDVRNFGAIARTAECAGVDAIIIPERGSVSVTADAVKTSAGRSTVSPSAVSARYRLLSPSCRRTVFRSSLPQRRPQIYIPRVSCRFPSVWSLGLKITGCHRMSCAVRIRSSVSPRSVLSVRSMSRSLAVSSSMRSCVRQASVLSDSPFIIATLHYAH